MDFLIRPPGADNPACQDSPVPQHGVRARQPTGTGLESPPFRHGIASRFHKVTPAFFLLAAVASGSLVAGFPLTAHAADKVTLTIRGVVPATCSVTVSTTSATVDILRGQTAGTVASVQESCNAANGYTVSVASQNGGRLTTAENNSVAYTLHYGDSTSSSGSVAASRSASGDARQSTLAVSMPANPAAAAGEYQDTLTVSIVAK